ncbi:hypothetical protein KDN34_03675 [Shewanella yunxiaonensis]|uniref:Uncharacterized protein n=1 Tax=Shewanella yunxiaonensis TaxID=2829809 RepID=A0ABX7YUX8_9GAMM|nr:hypothetical protein [Shewanella yunxiaonensis]QUN06568.1 hypothetical protein KDN34_03675 [Shewanella yunxiaonensis]
MRYTLLLLIFWPCLVHAGQVIVKSDVSPEEIFAIRDELKQQHEWQEFLRNQQQIQLIQTLPLGCRSFHTPYVHYRCNGFSYRAYQFRGRQGYIGVPTPTPSGAR